MKKQFAYLCGAMLVAVSVQAADVKPVLDENTLDITKEEFEGMNYLSQMEYVNEKKPGLNADDEMMLQASIDMMKKKGIEPMAETKNEKGESVPAYQNPNMMYQMFKPADTDDEVIEKLNLKALAERRKKAVLEAKEKDGTVYQVDVDSFK